MFDSLFVETGNVTLWTLTECFLVAILCGAIISITHKYACKSTKSFLITTAILPVVVMAVIMMVNGNLGIGVAVAGSFSLIRFRSMQGKANDIVIIFLTMAVGIACGMGYLTFALITAVLVSLLNILFNKISVFDVQATNRLLKITIPEDLDYSQTFDDILKKYTKDWKLVSVKTVNLGTMYMLTYTIDLKDPRNEKDMIDELRCRNGNLTISSLLASCGAEEL